MLRSLIIVWAGGLLLAPAGCAFKLGNNTVEVGVKVNEQAVNDSLEHVALRLQNEMARMGLQVSADSAGDTARITSTSKSGQKFTIVLTRIRGPQGEQTNVHVDWDKASDAALWAQLILIAGQTALQGPGPMNPGLRTQ